MLGSLIPIKFCVSTPTVFNNELENIEFKVWHLQNGYVCGEIDLNK